KHSHGTGKSHEVDHHLRGQIVAQFNTLYLAGWKAQPWIDTKVNGFIFGTGESPHRAHRLPEPLQERHRLEKLERAGVFDQFQAELRFRQISILRPDRGSHS